jgi:8-oxo-dGTP diphosphatase
MWVINPHFFIQSQHLGFRICFGEKMASDEQGIFRNRYKVIPRTLIFLKKQGSILLLKGAESKKLWPSLYNGIGGHIEKGEDILTAAKRELSEETGIVDIDLFFAGTIMVDAGEDTGIAIYLFKGEIENQNFIPGKEGDLFLIPISDLDKFPLVEDLYQLIPRIFNGKMISGKYFYKNDKLQTRFIDME